MKKIVKQGGWALLTLIALSAIFSLLNPTPTKAPQEISLSQLSHDIQAGQVKKIVISGEKLLITEKDNKTVQSYKEMGVGLIDSLSRLGLSAQELQKTNIQIKPENIGFWSSFLPIFLSFILPILIFIVFFWVLFKRTKGGINQTLNILKSPDQQFNPQAKKEKISFDDIGDLVEAKEELMEVVDFLQKPERFQLMGAKIPRGVLLVGPPGCGKTLLARAIASTANVPFYYISGSEFIELFVGVGSRRVKDLFAKAKQSQPSIIFIDELDAIGRQRGAGVGGGNDEREQTLNQILVEMDGFERDSKVIILSATNRPDVLDPALLRPGRFDRRVTLDEPDLIDREEILKIHAKGKPLAENTNLKRMAERTPGFTGADLANIMNEAAILAARHDRKIITQEDLLESIEKVMLGPERKSHILSKKEKEITAYHEAGHALVTYELAHKELVHKISIISRGRAGGYTLRLPTEERRLKTKTEFLADLAVMLGGYSAEELVFGELTTGASNDIQRATELARRFITQFGMSDKFGPIMFGHMEEMIFLGKEIHESRNYSEAVAAEIDEELKKVMSEAHQRTKDVLSKNRDKLNKIAKVLIEKETIEKEEFEELMKSFSGQKI